MQSATRTFCAIVSGMLVALSIALLDPGAAFAQAPQSKFVEANGVKLHYLIAGKGDPVVLLHGYAETSHMWLPLIAKLSDKHTVIAPDLRGFGQSSAPADGYTKPAMATGTTSSCCAISGISISSARRRWRWSRDVSGFISIISGTILPPTPRNRCR